MKLSVIIPVFNTEKYIKKCLESVINQTYKNIEIIVINDGSTDNSDKIIQKYVKEYPKKIKYVYQENKGQAYSRNLGIKLSKGELITFVDSDDYIERNMYQQMIEHLERENTDMVICDMYMEKNNIKNVISSTNFKTLFNCSVSVCNKIIKKEFIKNIKFIEGIWYEDYNFFINLCLNNPKYSLCKEPLYNYQIHNNSTMNNNNSLKNLDIIVATEDILAKNIDKEIKELLIVEHILLETVNRVEMQKNKNKKYVLKQLNAYIHKHIRNIFKTKVYIESSCKRKIIIILNYYNLGFISKILLNLKGVLIK